MIGARRSTLLTLALFATAISSCAYAKPARETTVLAPAAARLSAESKGLKRAVFAGGCYWGVEAVFSHVKGVSSVVAGFHGGSAKDATYAKVSAGGTAHAEAVEVTYNPEVVRYDQLLRIFFSVVADPTQLNRQGPDTGTQYRSALVPVTEEQRLTASAYLAQLKASGIWRDPIVTRIEPIQKFYPAEAEHQDFMAKNPRHPYILAWDVAKVNALKRRFPGFWNAAFTRG